MKLMKRNIKKMLQTKVTTIPIKGPKQPVEIKMEEKTEEQLRMEKRKSTNYEGIHHITEYEEARRRKIIHRHS